MHDHANNFETPKDTFDDVQIIISSEENALSKFFENDYESFEPFYPITLEMTFTNWKKLDE